MAVAAFFPSAEINVLYYIGHANCVDGPHARSILRLNSNEPLTSTPVRQAFYNHQPGHAIRFVLLVSLGVSTSAAVQRRSICGLGKGVVITRSAKCLK